MYFYTLCAFKEFKKHLQLGYPDLNKQKTQRVLFIVSHSKVEMCRNIVEIGHKSFCLVTHVVHVFVKIQS